MMSYIKRRRYNPAGIEAKLGRLVLESESRVAEVAKLFYDEAPTRAKPMRLGADTNSFLFGDYTMALLCSPLRQTI